MQPEVAQSRLCDVEYQSNWIKFRTKISRLARQVHPQKTDTEMTQLLPRYLVKGCPKYVQAHFAIHQYRGATKDLPLIRTLLNQHAPKQLMVAPISQNSTQSPIPPSHHQPTWDTSPYLATLSLSHEFPTARYTLDIIRQPETHTCDALVTNGVTAHMLLDTGAARSCISQVFFIRNTPTDWGPSARLTFPSLEQLGLTSPY